MSLLWSRTANFDPHAEDQEFKRKIGEALDQSGLTYKTSYDAPRDKPIAPSCPNDGSCVSSHYVPMEGGFEVHMHQRNGRMDPYVAHHCADGETHPLPDTNESLTHPLHGLGVMRTPTETLAKGMQSYTFHPDRISEMRAHLRDEHGRH